MKNVKRVYKSHKYEVKYERHNFLIFSWLEKVFATKVANDLIVELTIDTFPLDKVIVLSPGGTELIYTLTNK